MTKQCCCCKTDKPVSEFYKQRSLPDGLHKQCKSCCKAYFDTDEFRKKKREVYGPRYKEQQIEYRKHPDVMNRSNARGRLYRKKYTMRWNARDRVNKEVRAGRLPSPKTLTCTVCNNKAQEYHHHRGYKIHHWLDVVPICIKCHRNIDRPN